MRQLIPVVALALASCATASTPPTAPGPNYDQELRPAMAGGWPEQWVERAIVQFARDLCLDRLPSAATLRGLASERGWTEVGEGWSTEIEGERVYISVREQPHIVTCRLNFDTGEPAELQRQIGLIRTTAGPVQLQGAWRLGSSPHTDWINVEWRVPPDRPYFGMAFSYAHEGVQETDRFEAEQRSQMIDREAVPHIGSREITIYWLPRAG